MVARLILLAGQKFGRFAGLFFVVPVIPLLALWLSLLDDHPVWFIAAAFVVLPIVTMAVALLVGMALAGLGRTRIKGVTRSDAPGLWHAWDQVAGTKRSARTVIQINDDMNAGIGSERPFFGLLGQRTFLVVGLPLLAFLDESAVRAILAHEEAHLRNRDTNGSVNLLEFEKALTFVFEYADPETTISGKLLYSLLGWLAPSIEKENVRLSRVAELAADRHSAASEDSARSLLLMAAAIEYAADEVYEPLRRELMGAMTPPKPPLDRLLLASPAMQDENTVLKYAREAFAQPDDPENDHPPFSERLTALGVQMPTTIEPVRQPALTTMLDESFVQKFIATQNDSWKNEILDRIQS